MSMDVSFNFDLISSMFWAYFIGFALTMGIGTAMMILGALNKRCKPKDTNSL